MSELIQMRNRIKVIETIKKITHAMRLISMSSHSRLKKKQAALAEYVETINKLFYKIQKLEPSWKHPILHPDQKKEKKELIILIGSQKGLCGNFNSLLFQTFTQHANLLDNESFSIVAVGKKAVDYAKEKCPDALIASYEEFNTRTLSAIAEKLSTAIMHPETPYNSVNVWSNIPKTFFTQKPQDATIIPLDTSSKPDTEEKTSFEGYEWEHTKDEVLNLLTNQYIEAYLHYLLFQSLLAEHAARFISMDSSTRNAQNILDETTLLYNKVRQAKITKELTELIGSF